VATTRRITVNGQDRPYLDLLGWCGIATAHYLPATVMPAGRTSLGLPVGVQVVGPYLEDRTTIDFAARASEVLGGFVPPSRYA
jgi:amidase